jgi:hypothetical protein
MIKHHLQRHKYKIVVGVPMAVLLASSLSLVRDPEQICLTSKDNRYVTVNESVTLEVTAYADQPINVISASLSYPQDLVRITSTSKKDSIVNLWSEEPAAQAGSIHFSGGIVSPGGFSGTGTVLTLYVQPLQPGNATITFNEVHMLAHDGTGREVACAQHPVTLFIRETGTASPDVNHDTRVNIFDLGLLSANILLKYEPLYDLNNDGKVSLSDLVIIFSTMRRSSTLGSLVLFWDQ